MNSDNDDMNLFPFIHPLKVSKQLFIRWCLSYK